MAQAAIVTSFFTAEDGTRRAAFGVALINSRQWEIRDIYVLPSEAAVTKYLAPFSGDSGRINEAISVADSTKRWVDLIKVERIHEVLLRGQRLKGTQLVCRTNRDDFPNEVIIDKTNVGHAMRWEERQSQRYYKHMKRKLHSKHIESEVFPGDIRWRFENATCGAIKDGLRAGANEVEHSRRLVLLAFLLSYQHSPPAELPAGYCSWSWESTDYKWHPDGFSYAFRAGRKCMIFGDDFMPTDRQGLNWIGRFVRLEEFLELAKRAINILFLQPQGQKPPLLAIDNTAARDGSTKVAEPPPDKEAGKPPQEPEPVPQKFMSVRVAAANFHASEDKVQRWCREDLIAGVRKDENGEWLLPENAKPPQFPKKPYSQKGSLSRRISNPLRGNASTPTADGYANLSSRNPVNVVVVSDLA